MKPPRSFAAVLNAATSNKTTYTSISKLNKRHFFGFSIARSKQKEYSARKLVGYSSEQLFDVVSDVRNYYKFVPFCKQSLVIEQKPDYLLANLQIGFPSIVENYTSRVSLAKPYLVNAVCRDGRLFHELTTNWRFSPGLKQNPQSCIIDFYLKFEFKSVIHSQLANMFFDKLCSQMEKAFIEEVRKRYGEASLPTHSLTVVKS